MTRTERATNPRAVIRDRSESKSGLNKSMPKNGAGTHNWGSYADERELEDAALADEEQELGDDLPKAEGKFLPLSHQVWPLIVSRHSQETSCGSKPERSV